MNSSDSMDHEQDDDRHEEMLMEHALCSSSEKTTVHQRYMALKDSLELLPHGKLSSAAGTHLVFGCLRLQASIRVSHDDENKISEMNKCCDDLLAGISRIRRISSVARLVADQLTNIAILCKDRIYEDATSGDLYSNIASVCTTLYIAVHTALQLNDGTSSTNVNGRLWVTSNAMNTVIETVAHVLGDEHVDVRISGLQTLSLLTSNSQIMELIREQKIRQLLSVHLPSSLLWVDVQSVSLAVPMIVSLSSHLLSLTHQASHPPGLRSSSVPREWEVAFKCMLKTNGLLIEKAMRQSGDVSHVSTIEAAAMTLNVIPVMGMHRLLPHSSNVITLGTKLLYVAFATESAGVVADAICSCLSAAWPLFQVMDHSTDSIGHVLTRRVFSSAVGCVMQAHRYGHVGGTEDEDGRKCVIQRCEQCAKDMISRLLIVNEKQTLQLLQVTEQRCLKYSSLSPALALVRDFKVKLGSKRGEANGQSCTEMEWTGVIGRFFTKIQ